MNQRDGCCRGLRCLSVSIMLLNEYGTHHNPDGSYDRIGCTAHLYEEEPDQPRPVGRCPRCKTPWFTLEAGFCGGCERYA